MLEESHHVNEKLGQDFDDVFEAFYNTPAAIGRSTYASKYQHFHDHLSLKRIRNWQKVRQEQAEVTKLNCSTIPKDFVEAVRCFGTENMDANEVDATSTS